MDHSDVWNLGKDSVDLRIKSNAFSRVQRYFPDCTVLVANLEAHVQEAENLMFPMKKAQEEAWIAAVAQEAFPKVQLPFLWMCFYQFADQKYTNKLNIMLVLRCDGLGALIPKTQ